jgi:hypothetical protein
MKRIATAVLVLGLLSGTSAFAQGDDHHHDHAAGPPTKTAGPTHSGPTGPTGPAGNTVHPTGGPTFNTGRTVTPTVQGPTRTFNGPGGQRTFSGPGGQNRTFNTGGPTFNTGAPNRTFSTGRPSFGAPGFRPGGNRPQYNAQYFPRTFNIGQRFQWRGGPWRGPQGFYYRPWFYGQILPVGWFSAQYYINDYYDYQLPVPPYGYEWIRNGPDALLVDIGSGEVVSSVPGVFY